MSNYLDKDFIYLSQIIGLPLVDINTNIKMGCVVDVVTVLRETYPKASALVVRGKKQKKKYYVLWENVKKIIADKVIFVENFVFTEANLFKPHDNLILLKEALWDKQVVDISGSKVVRINDLHLLHEQSNLWVVHIDVGYKGLLRRLGCLKTISSIFRFLFAYEFKDILISWKYVQSLTPSNINDSLHIKVQQNKFSELLPADLADVLMDVGRDEREIIFKSLDKNIAAGVLQKLPLKIRIQIAEMLGREEHFVGVINEMPMDEIVDLLAHLSEKTVNSFLTKCPQEKVTQIKDLLEHSEHIAGSLMNTEFVTTKYNMTAGEVLNNVKTKAKQTESFYYVYVLGDDDSLVGIVTLRQLLTVEPTNLVSEFMKKKVVKVKISTDIHKVAQVFSKYDFYAVPVVDKCNKLKGIITIKDALSAAFPEIIDSVEE